MAQVRDSDCHCPLRLLVDSVTDLKPCGKHQAYRGLHASVTLCSFRERRHGEYVRFREGQFLNEPSRVFMGRTNVAPLRIIRRAAV